MNKLVVLSLVLVSITAISEDVKSDLFGENEASKNYFDSFKMDCRQQTTQCIERKLAIDAENSFNDIFIISLDRDMQVWPNGELDKLKDALENDSLSWSRYKSYLQILEGEQEHFRKDIYNKKE